MKKALASFLLLVTLAPAASRLKELTSIEGVRDNQLMGYGLVVGLAGTGDRRQTLFSAQSLAKRNAVIGEISEGLATTQLPVARAGAAFQISR